MVRFFLIVYLDHLYLEVVFHFFELLLCVLVQLDLTLALFVADVVVVRVELIDHPVFRRMFRNIRHAALTHAELGIRSSDNTVLVLL